MNLSVGTAGSEPIAMKLITFRLNLNSDYLRLENGGLFNNEMSWEE